tara:strand:- start:61 stop:579 length:519 start_codon:yes stop_codon:yes gene_type:complete
MENLINKLKETKPKKILVTGGNPIYINKFSKDISATLSIYFKEEYNVINDSILCSDINEINKVINKKNNCVISGCNLLHNSDLINVDFIIFIKNNSNNATRNIEQDQKDKDDVLERVISIHNDSQILNPTDFVLQNSYNLKLRFFEYWVVPQLLFNPTKNTYLIKEESIVVI